MQTTLNYVGFKDITEFTMPYLGSYSNSTSSDNTVTAIGRAEPLVLQLNSEGKLVYTVANANLYGAFAQFDEEVDAQSSICREDRSNTSAIKMKADAGDVAADKYVNFFFYLKP